MVVEMSLRAGPASVHIIEMRSDPGLGGILWMN